MSVGGYLAVGWDGSRRYHIGVYDQESKAIAAAHRFEVSKESWPRVGRASQGRAARPVKTRGEVAERTGLETTTPAHLESERVTPPPSFNDLLESVAHPIRAARRNWPESWPAGSVVKVDISSPKFPGAIMLCDRVMADRYCQHRKWCVDSTTGYAVAKIDGKKVSFHRLVTQAKEGEIVDHINGDKLDNRMANFRFVDRFQHAQNRASFVGLSRYKGVSRRSYGRWVASIRHEGRTLGLGEYDTEEAAAEAYNRAAKELWGEYARLNEI